MNHLENQWNLHKKPLDEEREILKQSLDEKKAKMNEKLEHTRLIRQEIDHLNTELVEKDALIIELNNDLQNNSKASGKTTNRQFYTKRIIEIMANIDKQKKEINKVIKIII